MDSIMIYICYALRWNSVHQSEFLHYCLNVLKKLAKTFLQNMTHIILQKYLRSTSSLCVFSEIESKLFIRVNEIYVNDKAE